MAFPLIAWALGAGLLLLKSKSKRNGGTRSRGRQPSPLDVLPGIDWNGLDASTQRFAHQLAREAAEEGIPVMVTSGRRSASAQASAMLYKVGQGEDLSKLYRDKGQISALMGAPRNVASWTAILASYAASGRPISRHMTSASFDIRTRNLDRDEIEDLSDIVFEMGGRAVIEADHLHVSPYR